MSMKPGLGGKILEFPDHEFKIIDLMLQVLREKADIM